MRNTTVMENQKEIQALISLLDDTDQEVFTQVAEKLFSMGPEIIPTLERAWETRMEPVLQERIENLVHKIQFEQSLGEFKDWLENEPDDLLKAALILNRYAFPDLDIAAINEQIFEMRRSIWIELNDYLTPLEQINVVNQILFKHYRLIDKESSTGQDPRNTYLSVLLENRRGNPISMGMLYLILAQQLELPVYGVCLPYHMIAGMTVDYLTDFDDPEQLKEQVAFYIDPFAKGMVFTASEITKYLKRIRLEQKQEYFLPASNRNVVKEMLRYLHTNYKDASDQQKADEIQRFLDMMEEDEA